MSFEFVVIDRPDIIRFLILSKGESSSNKNQANNRIFIL